VSVSKAGRIITFYSYKGGTGRSMALANIAWILASNSKRVLVLDWDLEAPGLQRYFRPFLVDRELTSSEGIVDLINHFIGEAITPLEEGETLPPDWYLPLTDIGPYVISLNWKFPKGGQIDFIPAGRQGPDYAMRFAAINFQKFYDVLGGGAFIEELKVRMRSQYDYVLVDSRTGVSDTSGICTVQMPDTLVVCFTFNNQSIEGAASITQSVFEQRASDYSKSSLSPGPTESSRNQQSDGRYKSPYRFKVFPVPMRVDQAEQEKLELRKKYARWTFDTFIESIPAAERRAFWNEVEVPYAPYFAYEEILAPFSKEDPSDPKTCLAAFTRIASEITHKEVNGLLSLISPEQKLAVLKEFASIPVPEVAASTGTVSGSVPTGSGTAGAGIAAGGESSIEKCIRLAEVTFQNLGEGEREEARRLWMRLVRVPGPGEKIENSKVRASLKDLSLASPPLIEKFAASELLSVSKDDQTGETTVEVANEELLRSWPTLANWIKADRDLMIWRQDLQASKARWQERGRTSVDLLGGRPLAEARTWHKTHRKYLSDSEAEYIELSILEDEIRQKRERTRRIWLNAVRVAVVLLFAIVVFLALSRSNKSDMADRIASVAQQKIDASALGNPGSADQFQLGILLATEAQRIAPTAKAEAILKKNLALLPRRVSSIDLKTNVLGVALSPSGAHVLSVTGRPSGAQGLLEDGAAQLHDVSTGSIMLRMPFKQGSRTFELNSDATNLAIASKEKDIYKVEVLEVGTGTVVATINHKGPVYDMAFSPDGRYFATASNDRSAQVLDLQDVGRKPVVLTYTGALNGVAFSGDSRHIAVAGEDFQVHVSQITPGQPSWPAARDVSVGSTAFTIALSHAGEYLATLSYNNKLVNIWQVESGKMIKPLNNGYGVSAVSFSPDNKFIVTGGAGGNIKVRGLQGAGKEVSLRFEGDVDLVSFSPDENYLAAVGNSKVARVWHYTGDSFEESASLIQKSNFTDLAFGPPNLVVTASADNIVRVWMLGAELTKDLQYEACARLTRNLTLDEWNEHLTQSLGAYRKTCSDIP